MSVDKYPSIFSRQMEAIVYIFTNLSLIHVSYTTIKGHFWNKRDALTKEEFSALHMSANCL